MAHLWAKWQRHPCRLRDPQRCRAGGKSEVAQLWAKWLRHPCRLGGPDRCRAGGGNQKWPTTGQSGYVTPAVSGIPTTTKPRGGGIRSGVQVGKVATSPLPSRRSPPLRSQGGGGSEVAYKWAKWLRHPCRLGDPHRFRAGGEIRSGALVGTVTRSRLLSRGSPPLQSGGQNQKWPTCGQRGCITPHISGNQHRFTAGGGITSGLQVGKVATSPRAKSEVAHKWAKWLRHPCRLGDQRGVKSEVPHKWVTFLHHPCRLGDPHHSGGQNQKWPSCGQAGDVTPSVSGIPTAAERGGESQVAYKWAKWLR